MNFKDYLNSKNSSNSINEEFRTDAEGIKQLQAREFELLKKVQPYKEKMYELEKKRSLLQYRISEALANIMNGQVTDKQYSQVEKEYEKDKKELEKIDKEIDNYFDKVNSYYDEIQKIRSVVKKMVIRNAKKLGMDP